MGIFSRKSNPQADLAKALAKRGTSGRATVVSMRETGTPRADGVKEVEFELDLAAPDGTVRTKHRQTMNRYTLHKLAPGEPARVLYDRDDPQTLMVQGHARYRTEVVASEIVVVEVEDLG
jgi:hypothetical protein